MENSKDIPNGRICTKCGEYKPLENFYKDKRGKHGRSPRCKNCAKEKVSEFRKSEKGKEYVKQYRKIYREDPVNISKIFEAGRKYREGNKEKIRENKKEYAAKNKVILSAKARNRYQQKKELSRKRARENYRSNPERYKVNARNRKSTLKGSEGKFSLKEIQELLEVQKGCCNYCGADITVDRHIDHKTPLSRGGSNWIENIQLLCPSCNLQKYTKTHEEFLQYLEELSQLEVY